ncbi:hypothetical protein FRC00_007343, partial [Tulasnella sp. 408]
MDPPMQYTHTSSSHYPPAHPQLSNPTQIFQYPPANPPTTSSSEPSLAQPLDALPTEYDLVSQTPEERAVLLEVLRERRRVREIELRILEERRREREAVEQAVGSNAGSTNSPPSASSASAMSEWSSVPDIDRLAFSALGVTRHSQSNPASQSSAAAGPSTERYPAQLPPLSQAQHQRQQHLYPPRSANSANDATFMNYEHQPPASARPVAGVSTASSASSSFANVFDSLPPGLGLSADPTDARSPHHDNLQSRDALGPQETYGTTGHYAEPRDSVIQGSARSASQHDTPFEHGLYGHGTSLPPMTGNWGSPSNHAASGTGVSIGGSPEGHPLASSSSSSIFNSLPNQPTVPSMAPIVRSSPSNFTGDANSHLYDEPHRMGQAPLGYPLPRSRNPSLEDRTSPSPSHMYSTPSPNHHLHAQAPSPYDDQFHPSMQVKHPRFESGPSTAGPSYAPPTVGVGKWRAKELFENGRKTCKLPHVRVGGGELELSVWEVPWEVKDKKEFGTLMTSIKQLWTERVYARLAIPEVLEGGEDPWPPNANGTGALRNSPPPERTFKDVEEVIARGWPAREQLLRSSPSSSRDTHRRYLGLSWAKSRARRERAAGKLPDPSKYAEGAQDVLMENVRRTNLLVPPASTLVGMWIVDWDMQNRSVLLSTSAPFESSDAEDKNIIGVGELMTRVLQDYEQYKQANPTSPIRAPQHIWIATRSITALGNARMNDTLTRRRGFVPVDEYIALHPGTERSLFQSVPDGHAWVDEAPWIRNPESGELEVLCRWLGDEIDMARLDQIKDMEYGRK